MEDFHGFEVCQETRSFFLEKADSVAERSLEHVPGCVFEYANRGLHGCRVGSSLCCRRICHLSVFMVAKKLRI